MRIAYTKPPQLPTRPELPPHFGFPHIFLAGSEIYDLAEFYEAVERERQAAVDVLVKKYHTIGPVLGKIEEVGRHVGESD